MSDATSRTPAPVALLPVPAVEVRTGTRLPRGGVQLLTTSLAGDALLHRGVWLLRSLHLAWLLSGLGPDRARVVSLHDGAQLLGVAVAIRYDARPGLGQLARCTGWALLVGLVLSLAAAVVPQSVVLGVPLVLAAAAVVGAALLDGDRGRASARSVRERADQLGHDRAWGRGLVAVARTHHGRGLGTTVTTSLVASLPPGHRWLPVALTPTAGALYARVGGRPLDAAASELVAPLAA